MPISVTDSLQSKQKQLIRLGVDATNLRQGGGRTHLIEFLSKCNPIEHGFSEVVVWGSKSTLSLLPRRDWLILRSFSAHEGGLLNRTFWQYFQLPYQFYIEECDLLFVPGGIHSGKIHPCVSMSQNLLPFNFGN